jgi:hypothetical protein
VTAGLEVLDVLEVVGCVSLSAPVLVEVVEP